MITTLSASDVIKHRKRITELFSYCKQMSSGEVPDRSFCDEKIDALVSYLSEGKAYLFAELSDGRIEGFLWACRIMRGDAERMHILYFAVSEQSQGCGLGSRLIEAVEKKALESGIGACELNVHTHNERAKAFYEKRGYAVESRSSDERITLVKFIHVLKEG